VLQEQHMLIIGTKAVCTGTQQSEHSSSSSYTAMPIRNPVPNELARKMCRRLNSRTWTHETQL